MSETEDNSKKDGIAWMKKLQAEKHAETVATVEAAMAKPESERTGEDFLAAHRLEVEEHKKSFIKKSRLTQKSDSNSQR